MNIKMALVLSATLAIFSPALCRADAVAERFQYQSTQDKFTSPELKYDVAGIWKIPDGKDFSDGRIGVGLGVNYFFSDYFGVGGDTDVEKFDYPNHLNASLIARYPLRDLGLAPYLFGGFGRQFHEVGQWTGHIGMGVDFRLNASTGFFLDVRRTYPDETRDFTLCRLGIRIGF